MAEERDSDCHIVDDHCDSTSTRDDSGGALDSVLTVKMLSRPCDQRKGNDEAEDADDEEVHRSSPSKSQLRSLTKDQLIELVEEKNQRIAYDLSAHSRVIPEMILPILVISCC